MKENEIIELAKEAYTLSQQMKELEESIKTVGERTTGYHAYARNFNAILKRARTVLAHDATILRSIEHISEYDPDKQRGY